LKISGCYLRRSQMMFPSRMGISTPLFIGLGKGGLRHGRGISFSTCASFKEGTLASNNGTKTANAAQSSRWRSERAVCGIFLRTRIAQSALIWGLLDPRGIMNDAIPLDKWHKTSPSPKKTAIRHPQFQTDPPPGIPLPCAGQSKSKIRLGTYGSACHSSASRSNGII